MVAVAAHASEGAATLVLRNADVWTLDAAKPSARAVAIRADRIVKVGTETEVLALAAGTTEVLDLRGAFVLPGFIDAHTHFGNAIQAFFEVRVVDVNEEPLLLERLRAAARNVPAQMWITGHGWASFAAAKTARDAAAFQPMIPDLARVDAVTPNHPLLLRRYDGAYFANSRALQLARIDKHTPDPANGRYVKDPQSGELSGLLLGTAGERLAEIMPPPSRARDLIAAQTVLRELAGYGITSIHDIARIDAISQTKVYRTHLERSTTDLSLFTDLRARNELTVRVQALLTLGNWRDYAGYGIRPGGGDDFIRYGPLKGFVDSYAMSAPFLDTPQFAGGFTFRVTDEQALRADIIGADAAGFDSGLHVTGDLAQRLLLDWWEDAIRLNPERERRFRLIHTWYPARAEVARAGRIGALADLQPYHLVRELDSMERRLGPERAAFAFPWRSLQEQGVRISLSSDWPGSYDRANIAPLNPLENMYYAVTRQRLDGTPAGGFHPEQALTIDEAIRGYTMNPAYGAREENIKGSITAGKLADLVVLDRNIRTIEPRELPRVAVQYTILGGRVIYARSNAAN